MKQFKMTLYPYYTISDDYKTFRDNQNILSGRELRNKRRKLKRKIK